MPSADEHQPRDHTFQEVSQREESSTQRLGIEDLREVPLAVTMELGSRVMRVREVLELKPGMVVPLNKLAGEMADIHVNGLPLARGEVMVIGDDLQIRVGDILGAAEEPGA